MLCANRAYLLVLLFVCVELRAEEIDRPVAPFGIARVAGISVGSRVRRGPDWRYGDQDGAAGAAGTVVELRAWQGSNDTLGIRVRWDETKDLNTYRWAIAADGSASSGGKRGVRDLTLIGEIALNSLQFMAAQEAAFVSAAAALPAPPPALPLSQKERLLHLYSSCGGARWYAAKGWRQPASDPCVDAWEGVTCKDGAVLGLDLAANNVSCLRELPASLGGLQGLQSLNLERNGLRGAIPPALCDLLTLRHLNLGANALAGPVPDCIAALPRLETLSLHSNDLRGRTPALLLRKATLRLLHLHGNPDLAVDAAEARAARIPSL
jgi:hypothetical protein